MREIHIQSIPHKKHRKGVGVTSGDWFTKNNIDYIKVSKMSDPRYELLIAVHELIEKSICEQDGITVAMVDKFDYNWKEHDGISEAGNDPNAPYHKQHRIAEIVERLLAVELGVDWNQYDKEVMSL